MDLAIIGIAIIVEPDYLDLLKTGYGAERIILIRETIFPDGSCSVCKSFDENRFAPFCRSNLESSSIVGERIVTLAFVVEGHGNQEFRLAVRLEVYIANLFKEWLAP